MTNDYTDLMDQPDLFVDESGLTSLEPDGDHPHHHTTGPWQSVTIADMYDRWEGRTAPQRTEERRGERWSGLVGERVYERGIRPAEGDGRSA